LSGGHVEFDRVAQQETAFVVAHFLQEICVVAQLFARYHYVANVQDVEFAEMVDVRGFGVFHVEIFVDVHEKFEDQLVHFVDYYFNFLK
jgi:hypothetical protein